MKKKQLTIIILAIVAIIIATIAYSGRTQNVNSEEQIKIEKTVKQFILEDYNNFGEKSSFTTVGNDKFKKILTEKNKDVRKNRSNEKRYNHKYNFESIIISKKRNNYKTFVTVIETYTLTPKEKDGNKNNISSSENEYEIYLKKINNQYKVMSGYMKPDAGAPNEDINKTLGYK